MSASLEAPDEAPASERDWTTEPLGELIEHICATHHAYTRSAIARIPQLLNKVCSVHGANHAELFRIQETFDAMAQELATHLMKEEMMLFPYIARMEEAVIAHEPVLPPPFGTVRNPVRMMMAEHDSAGDGLREIRALSNGYTRAGRRVHQLSNALRRAGGIRGRFAPAHSPREQYSVPPRARYGGLTNDRRRPENRA